MNEIRKQLKEANRLWAKQRAEEARGVLEQINIEDVDDIGLLIEYGTLALDMDEKIRALNAFSRAVDLQPENTLCLDSLAKVLLDLKKYYQAKKLLEQSLAINPDNHIALMNLGALKILEGHFSEAIELLEKARELKASDPSIYPNLVYALRMSGFPEQAMKYQEKLIRVQPGKAENYNGLGRIYNELGQLDKATQLYEKAIQTDKTYGLAYFNLVSVKKYSEADSAFIKKMEKVLSLPMDSNCRSFIHFSLGKVYNDCKEWQKAFDHYQQANNIAKVAIHVPPSVKHFKQMKQIYKGRFFETHKSLGSTSKVPVFVVGMPRTGTTLIEQIIAAHPDAAGAGELTTMAALEAKLCPPDQLPDYQQEFEKHLNQPFISELQEQYLSALREKVNTEHSDTTRIVDKMPDNFLYLGLIKTLFPQAHIIHAIRNPLDTCLSCYFQPFAYQHWSYDIDWIAERYHFYRQVMDYWKKALPENSITDVYYENLINNPEAEIRSLIEACGLQWHPACMEFYKEKRTISTASLWQARQPVYSSSRKRWLNYAKQAEPLSRKIKKYLGAEELEAYQKLGVKLKSPWLSFLS